MCNCCSFKGSPNNNCHVEVGYSVFKGDLTSICKTREVEDDDSLLSLNCCVASFPTFNVFKVVHHEYSYIF